MAVLRVLVLRAEGHLSMDTLERCLVPGPRFSLAGCTFVDPYGLVVAACVAEQAGAAGQRSYDLPRHPEVAAYCERMELIGVLADGAGMRPSARVARRPRRDRSDVLAELHRLQVFDGGTPPVAVLVARRLAGRGPAEEAFDCVAEACLNVGDHAKADGYAAAQVYGEPGRRSVALGIADPGQGIAASLAGRYGPLSDRRALQMVVEEGASASGQRGCGVSGIVSIVDELGGTLVLRSGTVACRRHRRTSTYTTGADLAGTAVGIALPCA